MILKNREIKKIKEIEAIINETDICYVGMVNDNQPYVLPFNFVYNDNTIYLHTDNVGLKIDIWKKNPQVCVNFNSGNELFYRNKEVGCSWGMKFKSVNAFGKLSRVEDYDEKYRIMKLFMMKYAGEDYEFSEPSIRNLWVYEIDINQLTGKKYGY